MAGWGVRGLLLCFLCLVSIIGLPAQSLATEKCHPLLEAALDEEASGPNLFFPQTHLFLPLLADPREPRFFLGYRHDERSDGDWHLGIVGFGETFPLYRRVSGCAANGWQLDISGGGVARFDIENDVNDMVDADYLFALPLSWRRGNWALRARILHESSHLGESPRIGADISERRKRSIDSVDLIASYARTKWRFYGGGEYVRHHYPKIKRWSAHLGAEYYGPRSLLGGTARWIIGVDAKAWEEFDYEADVSVKTGLSFGGRRFWQHNLQLMLEWYDGHANSGVFFEEKIRYYGAGLYFGF